MDLKRLSDPFPASDVEWRVQRAGKSDRAGIWAIVVPYITNRAIMQRLDDVCGPGGWRNEYREGPAGGVLCGIGIRIGDEWVTKWDGAENTGKEGMESGMAVKGGLSGAMKRAAVQWGIGRYLYSLDEGFASVHADGQHRGRLPEKHGGDHFKWDPPALPAWAIANGNGAGDRKPGNAPPTSATSSGAGQRTTQTSTSAPTCPNCDGPVWDNRAKKASGEYKENAPDFACKDKECGGKIWPEKEGADEAAELDRIVGVIQSMVNEIKGLDADDGDAAQKVLDEYVRKPGMNAERLHRLQSNIAAKLDSLKKPAAVGADREPGEDDIGPDDALPF